MVEARTTLVPWLEVRGYASDRITCSYVGRKDLVKAISQLRCTVGVKSATHEEAEDSIILIAMLDPKHDVDVVTDRLRNLATSWGKGPNSFPARVEV